MAWLKFGQPTQAIEAINQAREIYGAHRTADRTGHAEALTHLALAYRAAGKETAAGFALEEALSIVQETQDYDQLFRVLVAGHSIGLDLYPLDRILDLLETGAAAALESERPGTAYLRFCQGASAAIDLEGSAAAGLRLVRRARELEAHIDPRDPHVPKLRLIEALLLRRAKAPDKRVTAALIEGAHHWYRGIAAPLTPADFLSRSSDLHMHVRLLAGCLFEAGRHEESVVAFEAGRALGYAVEVDREFFSRVVLRNPFLPNGSAVDVSLLRQAQQRLTPDEVAVVLAVIPPHLIAFVVGRGSVEPVAIEIGHTSDDLVALDTCVKALPRRLWKGEGLEAMPKALLVLGTDVTRKIGSRSIAMLAPYDSLHLVPWRLVLRQSGLAWRQLSFPVAFNFLLRQDKAAGPDLRHAKVLALGHGAAVTVDLREEARMFAEAFGENGTLLAGCSAQDVEQALRSGSVVLLSCHGSAVRRAGGLRLVLELSDGPSMAEDVFPSRVVSPLVALSACDSGVYEMAWSDYPLGAGPLLLRRGATAFVGARFPVKASFAANFFPAFARLLAAGMHLHIAFARALMALEGRNADRWRDLACVELVKAL
jgi:hypothetical protein